MSEPETRPGRRVFYLVLGFISSLSLHGDSFSFPMVLMVTSVRYKCCCGVEFSMKNMLWQLGQ